jgi:Lrp/AsnC family leucine-responsive transcriptional regulator
MIDGFDAHILRLVQADCRRAAADLAAEVGLSPSAVQKRLTRLRQQGIIDREAAILSPKAAGGFMLFVVHIQLARGKGDSIERFRRLMQETPEVMQCFHVTGESDFVLLVAAPNIDDYEAFSNCMFVEENHVARFETNVVLRSVKLGLELPI